MGVMGAGLRSPQEGGDEDAGVQVEGGVPPSVGKKQDLSGSDGALQRRLLQGQVGVGVHHPGQGGVIGVEMRLLMRWVEEPALPAVDDL